MATRTCKRPLLPRIVVFALLMVTASLPGAAARAASDQADAADALYRATVIVTGYDMRSRPKGFAKALRQVLVKLSGEPRLRDDQRLDDIAAHADTLVSAFGYKDQMAGIKVHDDQGTYDRSYDLGVSFDHARIDRLLADLGEKPFLGERPVVVPVLMVHGVKGVPYLVSDEAQAAAEQRISFFNAGIAYGLDIEVPKSRELADLGASVEHFPPALAADEEKRMLVVGTLDFRDAAPIGWVGAWHLRWRGRDYAWGVSGVNFDGAIDDLARGALRVMSGHDGPQ